MDVLRKKLDGHKFPLIFPPTKRKFSWLFWPFRLHLTLSSLPIQSSTFDPINLLVHASLLAVSSKVRLKLFVLFFIFLNILHSTFSTWRWYMIAMENIRYEPSVNKKWGWCGGCSIMRIISQKCFMEMKVIKLNLFFL